MDKKQWQFSVLNIYFCRTLQKLAPSAPTTLLFFLFLRHRRFFFVLFPHALFHLPQHTRSPLLALAISPPFQNHSAIPRRHLNALCHLVAPWTFAPTDGVDLRRFLQFRPSPHTVSRGKNHGFYSRATQLRKNSRTVQFGRRLSGQHRADVVSFPTTDDQGLFVVKKHPVEMGLVISIPRVVIFPVISYPDGTGVLLDELPSDLSPSVCRSAAAGRPSRTVLFVALDTRGFKNRTFCAGRDDCSPRRAREKWTSRWSGLATIFKLLESRFCSLVFSRLRRME